VVFGIVSFGFNGIVWQDYLAEHATGQWWRFGVKPDRGMKLAAFDPRLLDADPRPVVINYQGETYRVTDSGQANYRAAGQAQRIGQFDSGQFDNTRTSITRMKLGLATLRPTPEPVNLCGEWSRRTVHGSLHHRHRMAAVRKRLRLRPAMLVLER
jgi:hypothetical protein